MISYKNLLEDCVLKYEGDRPFKSYVFEYLNKNKPNTRNVLSLMCIITDELRDIEKFSPHFQKDVEYVSRVSLSSIMEHWLIKKTSIFEMPNNYRH